MLFYQGFLQFCHAIGNQWDYFHQKSYSYNRRVRSSKSTQKKCKLCWVFPDFLTTSCCSKFKYVGRILPVFTLTKPDKLQNMCPKEAILLGFLAILSRYRKSISLPSSEVIFIQPKGAKFKAGISLFFYHIRGIHTTVQTLAMYTTHEFWVGLSLIWVGFECVLRLFWAIYFRAHKH